MFFADFKLFSDWFDEQSSIIEDIGLNCFPEGEVKFTHKHRNDFFIKFNQYINSDEFEKRQFSFWKDTIKTHKARPADF